MIKVINTKIPNLDNGCQKNCYKNCYIYAIILIVKIFYPIIENLYPTIE